MTYGPDKEAFVAKRFYSTQDEPHTVDCEENLQALFHDVLYIKMGEQALKEFYKHAERTGTEVATGTSLGYLPGRPGTHIFT